MNKSVVSSEESGLRLDLYLTRLSGGKSRNYAQKMIRAGKCRVNEEIVKDSYKVREGDLVEFDFLDEKPLDLVKKDIHLDILYQDEDVLVVNKPRGMVVHPSNGHYDGDTLVNALLFSVKDLSSINGVVRPGIVHRIDKNTSGLLVIAKNDEAHLFLSAQLQDHTMHREYYALVEGVIPHTDIKIDAPIGRDPKDRMKRAVDIYEGKEAVTYVHVEERMKAHTLISCRLETGRTHQIRVHLKYIGYPLVGDPEYGRRHQAIPCSGQMLHAYRLSFIHPRSKEKMVFTCPIDEEFDRVLSIARGE